MQRIKSGYNLEDEARIKKALEKHKADGHMSTIGEAAAVANAAHKLKRKHRKKKRGAKKKPAAKGRRKKRR